MVIHDYLPGRSQKPKWALIFSDRLERYTGFLKVQFKPIPLIINEVNNIKLQIGKKVEELKHFFAEGSLKALDIVEKFLIRANDNKNQRFCYRTSQK